MSSTGASARITRRNAAALVAAAPLLAQVTSKLHPQGSPVPAPASATPQAKLEKAVADVRQVSQRLSQLEVPINVEPAFAFKP